MPASTLMVKSRGSYWRTRRMAAVEVAVFDRAAGPPISRLEKCPPNANLWYEGGGDRDIRRRRRPAHQPLGEMPPQLDRLVAGGRPAHGLGEFLRTLRPHDISRVIRHSSRRTGGAECSEER